MTGIRFERLFRASVYLMLVLASLALSVDATRDNPIAMAYPLATVFIGVWAYFKVDGERAPGLSRRRGVLFSLLTIPLVIAEVRIGWQFLESDLLVLALGHWLLYLVWIKMVMPKSIEDDWFLFLLGLVIVLTAAVLSQSDIVGQTIFLWAIASLWSLSLFYLEREAARSKNPLLPANLPAEARVHTNDQPYIKLFDRPFFITGLRVVATTLFMSVVVFLLMPRGNNMRMSRGSGSISRHLTGFDEEVKLGQLGEILENDAIVLTVEFLDSDGKITLPPGEQYWRGVTMGQYDSGQWRRQNYLPAALPRNADLSSALRQRIRQEPSDSTVVFGLRPILAVNSLMRFRSGVLMNGVDGTMSRRSYNGVYEYEVFSSLNETDRQAGELPLTESRRETLTSMPSVLREQLAPLALPLIKDISRTDTLAQARALEAHFFDSNIYAYTLDQTRIDPNIDPVLDFLKNRKEGHCEYFASAMALMLRSVGIPSRLVNGFKGGDWNALGQVMHVREKHAHAWVEAWVSSSPDEAPRWVTFDPTPGNERAESIARVGLWGSIRQATDFIRYIWVFYIIGFDSERQYRVIYQPIIALFLEAKSGFLIIIQAFRELFSGSGKVSDIIRLFSAKGFFGGLVLAVLAIGLLQFARFFYRRIVARWFKKHDGLEGLTPGIAIYQRLEAILKQLDLQRSRNETPQEFADRVGFVLRDRFQEQGSEGVPQLIVRAFYQIRFGSLEISPAELARIEERLSLLESRILQPVAN